MFKKINVALLFLLSVMTFYHPMSITALIKDISSMDAIESYVDEKTAVFFDIDDTILIPATSLGSSSWWKYVDKKVKADLQKDLSVKKYITSIAQKIISNLSLRLVEYQTASIIESLQARNIPTYALTARHIKNPHDPIQGIRTALQLNEIGIHFEKTPVDHVETISPFFHQGILFSNFSFKGPVLLTFLRETKLSPSKIVMIDDNLLQLQSIEESLNQVGIPFIGLHYHGADLLSQKFSPLLANIELRFLINEGKVLSEEEAQEIAETQNYPSEDFFIEEIITHIKQMNHNQ